jgi:hypothetical protein
MPGPTFEQGGFGFAQRQLKALSAIRNATYTGTMFSSGTNAERQRALNKLRDDCRDCGRLAEVTISLLADGWAGRHRALKKSVLH